MKSKLSSIFVILFLLAFSALICLAIIPPFKTALGQLAWMQTACLVESSNLEQRDGDYRIEVKYRYRVGTAEHQSNQYQLPTNSSFSASEWQRRFAALTPGTTVPCWYDPQNSEQAVLQRETAGIGFVLIFPLVMSFIAYIVFRATWQKSAALSAPSSGVPSRAKPSFSFGLGIYAFFGIFVVVGLALSYFFFWLRYSAVQQSLSWTAIPCQLEEARVESRTSTDSKGKQSTSYTAQVRYTYSVDGRNYIGTTYNPASLSYSDYEDVSEKLEELRESEDLKCFVNLANPFESTLSREIETEVWFGLIPMLFTFAGLLGAYATYFQRRPKEQGSLPGRVRYRSQSRVMGLVGLLLINIVWNGLTFGAAYAFWFDGGAGSWLPLLILTPFALIGAFLILLIPYSILQFFNPRLELELSQAVPQAGTSFSVFWKLSSNTGRVKVLDMVMELMNVPEVEEEQDVANSTTSQPQPVLVKALEVVRTDRLSEIHSGTASVAIPSAEDLAFLAPAETRFWRLRYKLEIPFYPDYEEQLELRG